MPEARTPLADLVNAVSVDLCLSNNDRNQFDEVDDAVRREATFHWLKRLLQLG